MAQEREAPDAILEIANLQGSVTDIQDDPDSPDGNWLTAIANNVDSIVRVSFPTPSGNPKVGANLQEFRALVRKYGGTGTPTARIELYENGVLLRAGADINITGPTVIAFLWNANEIGTPDGSLVECRVFGDSVGGAPAVRATIEVGAVEWNCEYETTQTISGAGNIGSGEVHGTLKIVLFILAAALASTEAAGSPWVNQSLSAASISSEEAPGSPTVLLGPMTVSPAAVASAETFGLAQLNQTLAAVAISSAEALGGPRLNLGLSPPGIASGEAWGAATVLPGAVTVSPAGVPSAEAPGAPQINRTLLALGLDSAESFGAPVLLPGGLTLEPSGIPGGEVLGSPLVYFGSVLLPEGITAGETLGLPLVQPGPVALWPSGLGTQEALGLPVIFPPILESLRMEATLREAEVPVSLSPAPQTGVFLCPANVEVHLDG